MALSLDGRDETRTVLKFKLDNTCVCAYFLLRSGQKVARKKRKSGIEIQLETRRAKKSDDEARENAGLNAIDF